MSETPEMAATAPYCSVLDMTVAQAKNELSAFSAISWSDKTGPISNPPSNAIVTSQSPTADDCSELSVDIEIFLGIAPPVSS